MVERSSVSPKRRKFTTALLSASLAGLGSPIIARADAPTSPPQWRVGFLINYSPFSFLLPSNRLTGFDYEVVTRMAEMLGISMVAVGGTMRDIQRKLQAGEIDFIGNQLWISTQNRKEFDFARAYANNQLVCVQHEDDQRDFLSLDDLFGLKVGVLSNTGTESQVRQVLGNKAIGFPRIDDALHQLAEQKLDAVLEESLIVDYHIEKDNLPIKTTAPFAPPAKIGLAIPKGHAELQAVINKGIDRLFNDQAFQEISIQWFGYDVSRVRASAVIAE